MKNKTSKIFTLLTLLLTTSLAQAAISLGFNPKPQSGNIINVGIIISGLDAGSTPSLGVYDLDIHFDFSHLAFANVFFGDPVLGNQLDLFDLGSNPTSSGMTNPGILNLSELSLDSVTDLDNLQASSFTLATLSFSILNPSTSQLTMAINALGDAEGNSLAATSTIASISTVVPLPLAFLMMLPGMVGIALAGKKRVRPPIWRAKFSLIESATV